MGALLSSFFAKLTEWLVYPAKYLAGVVVGVFESFLYYAKLILYSIINPLFDLITAMLDATPIPAYLTTINAAWVGPLGFWAGYFLIPQAAAAVVAAYMIRFSIRRIPIIG